MSISIRPLSGQSLVPSPIPETTDEENPGMELAMHTALDMLGLHVLTLALQGQKLYHSLVNGNVISYKPMQNINPINWIKPGKAFVPGGK